MTKEYLFKKGRYKSILATAGTRRNISNLTADIVMPQLLILLDVCTPTLKA